MRLPAHSGRLIVQKYSHGVRSQCIVDELRKKGRVINNWRIAKLEVGCGKSMGRELSIGNPHFAGRIS